MNQVTLGWYPLCSQCQLTNGGLVSAAHPQVHIQSHGQESCVDELLVPVIEAIWEQIRTTGSCQGGEWSYINVHPETRSPSELLWATELIAKVMGVSPSQIEVVDGRRIRWPSGRETERNPHITEDSQDDYWDASADFAKTISERHRTKQNSELLESHQSELREQEWRAYIRDIGLWDFDEDSETEPMQG